MSIGRRTFIGRAFLATLLIPAASGPAVARGRKAANDSAPPAPPKPETRPLVMLDPGHGGKDPGAIGVSGTYEKRIALESAHLLKRSLEGTGRYRVRLTRMRDMFIPLEQRVALAERHGAALFISMHADSLPKHDVRGASVYTFAVKASDPESAALATRENSADRFAPKRFRHLKPEVRHILSSLIVEETRMGSAAMQHAVVDGLSPHVLMLRHPARSARFAVLRSVTIPSVLVEMGFMSNRRDEKLLRQPRHRAVIVAGMLDAVDSYFASARNAKLFAG